MQLITPFFFYGKLSLARSLFTFRSREKKRNFQNTTMTTDGIDGRVVRTKRGFCSFLSSETRAHTHKSRERGVFFFFFFPAFFLITLSISLKPYIHTAAFFLRPFAKKSFDITFLLFFRPIFVCLFFCRQKTHARTHEREKRVAVK